MQNILRTNFDGEPNIGLYGFASDSYCFTGADRYAAKLKDTLKVPVHVVHFLNMDLAKIFCAGNSRGIVTPKVIKDFDSEEVEKIRKHADMLSIDTVYSSVGHLVLMTDSGLVLSPLLQRHRTEMSRFFGIECALSK